MMLSFFVRLAPLPFFGEFLKECQFSFFSLVRDIA